jgi:hypothetical protein
MKKKFFLLILCLTCLLVGLMNGCKKDSPVNPPTNIGTTTSFTEEFDSVYKLETKGWVNDNYAVSSVWTQGFMGNDKAGVWYGFSAYSYTASPDEFIYAGGPGPASSPYSISTWLITPVLSIKNGDKFSFYTRGDTTGTYTNRMQVRMNRSASSDFGRNSANSVGGFTTILFDINSVQAAGGYPTAWTKYEYVFSGISGKIDTRIGFRHYVTNTTNAKGIGIDLFRFQVN